MGELDKELAVELTIAIVKARAEVVASVHENNVVKQKQLESLFSDTAIVATFEKINKTIASKDS